MRSGLLPIIIAAACGPVPGATQVDELPMPNLWTVIGSQDVVATISSKIDVYRQDPARPTTLTLLGTFPIPNGPFPIADVSLTPDWLVATLGGTTTLVSLVSTPLSASTLAGSTFGTYQHAIARGDSLLVSEDKHLRLYSIADPQHQVMSSFTATVPIDALAAIPGGFVAIGRGRMLVIAPGQTAPPVERADANLPLSPKAMVSGSQLVVAGASTIPGRSRIVRYDVTDPASFVTARVADDLPGNFQDAAWDGGTTYCLFTPFPSSNVITISLHILREQGSSLREIGGSLTAEGRVSADPTSLTYAWSGMLYLGLGQSMGVYQLP